MKINVVKQHAAYELGEHEVDDNRGRYLISMKVAEEVVENVDTDTLENNEDRLSSEILTKEDHQEIEGNEESDQDNDEDIDEGIESETTTPPKKRGRKPKQK